MLSSGCSNFAVIRNDGKLIAGFLQVEPAENRVRDALWMPSVSVADVDAAVELVQANGGTILNGPVDMDKRGRAVLISDPQRADLLLLNAKGGDPVDAEAAIGDWLWDEIWTDDPEVIKAFYAAVLGYDQMVSGDNYDVFMYQGKWRAGMRHLQDKNEHMLWVPVTGIRTTVTATMIAVTVIPTDPIALIDSIGPTNRIGPTSQLHFPPIRTGPAWGNLQDHK